MTRTIGIIGGTGKQGTGLAKRWAKKGYEIIIGSRDENRGVDHADKLSQTSEGKFSGGSNLDAAQAEIVLLSIPHDQIVQLIGPLKDHLINKIVLDVINALTFGKFPKASLIDGKSTYEFIKEFLPGSSIVSCFKTISHTLLDSEAILDQTDFIITADDNAWKVTQELGIALGLEPVRVRGKFHAHTIERMVALTIQINKEYPGSHVGYKLNNLKLTQQ